MFTWPGNYDDPEVLLSLVGDFWAHAYSGRALVKSALSARASLDAQTYLDTLELLASVSRFKIPVFHTRNWSPLVLAESQLNRASADLADFDGTYRFDGTLSFGEPPAGSYYVWQLPPGLTDVKLVMNRITLASLTYTEGVDFFIKGNAIWLRENPFGNPLTAVREVFQDNAVVDREATLWAYRGQWDLDNVYTQFGYVLGLKMKSSEGYKDLVNACFDGLVSGLSGLSLRRFFAALADAPVAEAGETVQAIFTDSRKTWVVTDQNAYGFSPNSTVTVAVGDTLAAGDTMTDAVVHFEFGNGQVPSSGDIRALAVGPGLLAGGYFQDLVFENKQVPLVVSSDANGITRVEFQVGGWPADVEKLWNDTHSAGVAAGQTLAQLLDTRQNKVGQPTALALPATVNPLGFLLQNVFRDNLFVVKLRTASFGSGALGLDNARILRKLMPPQTACVLLVELTASDTATMDGPGDATTAGYLEDVAPFACGTASESVDPSVMVSETVRCYQVGGQCL